MTGRQLCSAELCLSAASSLVTLWDSETWAWGPKRSVRGPTCAHIVHVDTPCARVHVNMSGSEFEELRSCSPVSEHALRTILKGSKARGLDVFGSLRLAW